MIILRYAVIALLILCANSQIDDDIDDDIEDEIEDDTGSDIDVEEIYGINEINEVYGINESPERDDDNHNDNKYNILALVPYNGKSHFLFAEVLFEELARRGHNVTVVSHFPRKKPLENYHDISMESPIADALHNISMEEATATLTIFEVMSRYSTV